MTKDEIRLQCIKIAAVDGWPAINIYRDRFVVQLGSLDSGEYLAGDVQGFVHHRLQFGFGGRSLWRRILDGVLHPFLEVGKNGFGVRP